MKILVYALNYEPEPTGAGKYTGEMSSWFAEQGHEVRVVCSQPYYPEWRVLPGHKNWYQKQSLQELEVIRCPLYIPAARQTALKRLLHLISFAVSSFVPLMLQLRWKPDVVIQVMPTIVCSPQTLLFGYLSKAKSVAHVQDFEVDAVVKLGMLEPSLASRMASDLEGRILRSFDYVSTISEGMRETLVRKKVDGNKTIYFPNWADAIDIFGECKRPRLLDKLGISSAKKLVLYSGNIGEKQGLEYLLEAAKKLEKDEQLQFLIVGEGLAKDGLVRKAYQMKLVNVAFAPLQSKEDLYDLLETADCHLVLQKADLGDAVLPSKLCNIFAVGGNCVVTAEAGTSLAKICEQYQGIAVLVKPESAGDLARAISKTLLMEKPNAIAKKFASENLFKSAILKNFLSDIS